MADEQETLDGIEKFYGSEDASKAPKAKIVKDVPEAKQVQKQPETPPVDEKADPAKADGKSDIKPDAKTEAKPEDKKPEAKTDKAVEKIETKPDEYFDPLEKKAKAKKDKPQDTLAKKTDQAPNLTEDQLKLLQEAETYKKEAEAFRKIKESPIGQIMLEAQELGKNPIEILQELQVKDYRSFPETTLAREYFSKVEGLKGEELETAVEEFTSLDEGFYKNREKRNFITSLETAQKNAAAKYLNSVKSASEEAQQIAVQFDKDVNDVLKESYKGKKPYGIELSPEQYSDLEESVRGFTLRNEDGFIDADRVAFFVFAEKFLRSMRKNDYNKGMSEGMEKVLLSVHNPDRNDQGMSNRPVKAAEKTAEDGIEERFGNKAPQQPL